MDYLEFFNDKWIILDSLDSDPTVNGNSQNFPFKS